jgi:hypothetical protein
MVSEMTPFDAYQVRMERRFGEMLHAADVELNRLHGEAVKVNAEHNSGSIFPQLAAVQQCVEAATEEALVEGKELVDEARRQGTNAPDLWLEATADKARLVLTAHVEALYALRWRIDPKLLPGVTPAITEAHKNALAHANGAVDDFANGVWRPKPRLATGATAITHNVHIGGNMAGGVIQQAGNQAHQQTGETSSDNGKTFQVNVHTAIGQVVNAKTYVARASNNPVANAVFLAGQALTHPGRRLFFEEVSPGEDGTTPVLRVRVRDEPELAAGVVAKHKPPAAPVLTPVFNWLLVFVCLFVVAAFTVDVYAGFFFKGPATDATKSLLSVTDWIVKGGLGAIIGLIGGKVAK